MATGSRWRWLRWHRIEPVRRAQHGRDERWPRSADLEAVRLNGLDGILSTPQGGVDSIAFSPNGAILAAGMSDGSVRLYNASNHRLLTVLTSGDGSALDSLAFSPTGVRLAAGGADGIVRLWDLTDRHPVTAIVARRHSAVRALAFSPHGQLLAAGLDSGAVRQWNTKTYEPAGPWTLAGHPPPRPSPQHTYSNLPGIDGLAFSSNGPLGSPPARWSDRQRRVRLGRS